MSLQSSKRSKIELPTNVNVLCWLYPALKESVLSCKFNLEATLQNHRLLFDKEFPSFHFPIPVLQFVPKKRLLLYSRKILLFQTARKVFDVAIWWPYWHTPSFLSNLPNSMHSQFLYLLVWYLSALHNISYRKYILR